MSQFLKISLYYIAHSFFYKKWLQNHPKFVSVLIHIDMCPSLFLSLSIAETAASEKFKHADVLLQTIRGTSFKTHSSSLSPVHSTAPPTEPMYDNIEEKRRVHAVNIQALPEIQPCPAYAVPPSLPPGLHRPLAVNVQEQQYIEFD